MSRALPQGTLPNLSSLQLATEYRTGSADLVDDFYLPCLERASRYDRAAGYFRSSVLLIIQRALIDFARRGGRVRLVCSPEMSAEDVEALAQGYEDRDTIIGRSLTRDIDQLLATAATRDRTVALATLVATGALSVRIAFRLPGQGMYHEKMGVFSDTLGNTVTFKGSINESWSGWHEFGNVESFEVFCSWASDLDAVRISRHCHHFETLWVDRADGVRTTPFPDAAMRNLLHVARETLDDLHIPEREMPDGRKLLPHQAHALATWRENGCRGVIEHATGSGKTFTAITAIASQLKEGRVALVLVPSRLLLEQWALELSDEIADAVILRAGGGHDAWRSRGRIEAMTMPGDDLGPRVVLATMSSAHSAEFLSRVVQGHHLLIVADEVHRLGSTENSTILSLDSGARLGLSATPRRFGDPDGTAKILAYFGGILPPPFTLADAVLAGRLVPYEYFPHPVLLSQEEAQKWSDLALRIKREMAKATDAKNPVPTGDAASRIKQLLIRRARITKKATNKIRLTQRIVAEHYVKPAHWLVYCEDAEQLGAVRAALQSDGLDPLEYHSKMQGDRRETLAFFTRHGGILVSINCLDEGVDIPVVSHALILASSQNPRQFIQRRGRVLRRSEGKTLAAVHDAIVLPPPPDPDLTSLDGIFRNEVRRAMEFARGAINRSAEADLIKLAIDLNIETPELEDAGIEDADELD